jgi:hypothetical protein
VVEYEKPEGGYDWTVYYEHEEDQLEEMTVFGQATIEDAVTEARYSLRGTEPYFILGAQRG